MRTRACWIALVLTGGLALAPVAVRAQERSPIIRAQAPGELDVSGREAAPIIPLPIYNSRPEAGGFYAALEFVMYRQTRDLNNQVIAKRGFVDVDGSVQSDLAGSFVIIGGTPVFVPGPPGVPGTFLGSGTPALSASDLNSQTTYQPGFRATGGWRFSDGSTFEVRWLHVVPARYNAGADIIPPGFNVGPLLQDTFLFSPVYNFTNAYAGAEQELGVGNPGATYGIWNAMSETTIEFMQRYDQADFWGKIPVRSDPISRTYFVAGGRFAWIWERFKWRAVSRDSTGVASESDVAIYNNIVSNRMYGPTVGCQHEVYLGSFGRVGAFALTFHADASPMLDVVKERASYELGDRSTKTKKAVTEYTFAPMLNGELELTWYPAAGIQVRFSWNSVAFFNTVNNDNPVSFNFGNLGRTNDFGPGPNAAGTSDPIWSRKAIRYFDGISFGVALSF